MTSRSMAECRQYGFEFFELRLGRVLGAEAGGAQLHDKGVQDAVAVIGEH